MCYISCPFQEGKNLSKESSFACLLRRTKNHLRFSQIQLPTIFRLRSRCHLSQRRTHFLVAQEPAMSIVWFLIIPTRLPAAKRDMTLRQVIVGTKSFLNLFPPTTTTMRPYKFDAAAAHRRCDSLRYFSKVQRHERKVCKRSAFFITAWRYNMGDKALELVPSFLCSFALSLVWNYINASAVKFCVTASQSAVWVLFSLPALPLRVNAPVLCLRRWFPTPSMS